jgi:hypothetical protein
VARRAFPRRALAAFFLVVVNLGGAAADLFSLGYGRREEAPQRAAVLSPYLAAMNLVFWLMCLQLSGRPGFCRSPGRRWRIKGRRT